MIGNITRIDQRMRSKDFNTLQLVQITDCHLGSEPNECLLGLNTDQSLRDVLSEVKAHEKPDLLLVSGDISNDAGANSYMRFLRIVDEYFPETPLAWLPGNHDNPDYMHSVAGFPLTQVVERNGWNIILLDSRIPHEEGGRLSSAELSRLERELMAKPNSPTLIFLHHQPVKVGSAWVDTYLLENHQEFFELVDQYSQIKGIGWGHIHQNFESERNGVKLFASPSTCVQFEPNHDEFQVSSAMP
ncbi:MAG: Icc protein, partial [Flavobacteriales bacterium]